MEAKSRNGNRVNLEQLNDSLSRTQRLAGIGTLTASVAHELANPIAIITTTCNNLLSQVADERLSTDELLRCIQMIDQSAWRCARIVQTLRNYAHVDGPKLALCDLNTIVEDSLTLVAYQFKRLYKIELDVMLAPDLKPVLCDRNQITQVLINLLSNARDATGPQGGRIEIRSWIEPELEAVAISVKDSGSGIAPEHLDRLFEPFFTTKPLGEGTGLGLSIALSIVEQHQGRINVESLLGSGSTFTVMLPWSGT